MMEWLIREGPVAWLAAANEWPWTAQKLNRLLVEEEHVLKHLRVLKDFSVCLSMNMYIHKVASFCVVNEHT